jgi:RNA polymerase sigma factor (sigma-70 family)
MTMTDGAQDSLAGPDASEPDAVTLRAAQDVELLRLVRSGYDAAFAELFSRHAAAVRGFAVRCCTEMSDADDLAAEAFFRVLQAVRRGAGPDDNVRAYLLTVVRRLAAEWGVRRRDVPVTDEELSRQVDAGYAAPASRADLQLISMAFATLPQRWRAVLWRVEVEGERPAVVARYFGLSANATAALARRARQGLRAAYLQAHLAPTGGANGCRSVVDKLGGFTAGQVTGSEARRIRAHLNGCPTCAALHAELADVCAGLRRYAGSLTAPAAGLALGTHQAAAHQAAAHQIAGHQIATHQIATQQAAAAHHGLLATLAKLTGRLAGNVAAAGARAKLVVAAVSMAAVGGFGVAAGPIVAHLHHAVIDADRGDGTGQVLLHSVPGTSDLPGSSTSRSSASQFDPTMRSEVRGPSVTQQPRQPAVATVIATTTTVGPPQTTDGSAAIQHQPGDVPAGSDDTSEPSKQMQLQADPPQDTTTADSIPLSTTPAPGRHPTTTRAPHETVWSTSWTTDGTTVYETVWSWSDTVH